MSHINLPRVSDGQLNSVDLQDGAKGIELLYQ